MMRNNIFYKISKDHHLDIYMVASDIPVDFPPHVRDGFCVSQGACHRNLKRFWSLDLSQVHFYVYIIVFNKVRLFFFFSEKPPLIPVFQTWISSHTSSGPIRTRLVRWPVWKVPAFTSTLFFIYTYLYSIYTFVYNYHAFGCDTCRQTASRSSA